MDKTIVVIVIIVLLLIYWFLAREGPKVRDRSLIIIDDEEEEEEAEAAEESPPPPQDEYKGRRENWIGPCTGQECKTPTIPELDKANSTANVMVWPHSADSCQSNLAALAKGQLMAPQRVVRNNFEARPDRKTSAPVIDNSLLVLSSDNGPVPSVRCGASLPSYGQLTMEQIFPPAAKDDLINRLDKYLSKSQAQDQASLARTWSRIPPQSLPDHVPLST